MASLLPSPASSCSFSALGRRVQPPMIARLMTLALENPRLLSLAAGFTDNATLPAPWIAEAAAALCAPGADPEVLQYGTNPGRPGLRRAVGQRLAAAEPGLDGAALAAATLITNGSQQALALALEVLCDPGDLVLVDRPTYFVALELMASLGIRMRSLPVDAAGRLDGTALRRLLAELRTSGEAARLKAVYAVTYFANPSGRSFSPEEKHELCAALTDYELTVPFIEDAAYRDLWFHAPAPARTVLSEAAWAAFPRLYLGTFTKPFSSGLKVGYGVCTDRAWLDRMLHLKASHDFGSANFNQALLERALATGAFDAQLTRLRPAYAAKMQALHAALEAAGLRQLGWSWERPAGGLYLWLRAPESIDTGTESAFCHACIEAGVLYVPGALCFGDDAPKNYARLSYGVLGPGDLAEAARRFAGVAAQFA